MNAIRYNVYFTVIMIFKENAVLAISYIYIFIYIYIIYLFIHTVYIYIPVYSIYIYCIYLYTTHYESNDNLLHHGRNEGDKNSKQQEVQDVIAVSSLGREEGLTSKSSMEKDTIYITQVLCLGEIEEGGYF